MQFAGGKHCELIPKRSGDMMSTFRAYGSAVAMLCAVVLSACSRDPLVPVLYGNFLYNRGDFTKATSVYLDSLMRGRNVEWIHYNLANVYLSLGEADAALGRLELARDVSDSGLLFRVYYNLGNIKYHKGEYQDALTAYRQALEYKPTNRDAKFNYELSLRQLRNTRGEEQGSADASDGSNEELRAQASRLLDYIHGTERVFWVHKEQYTDDATQKDW